ncbi:CC0125/CC1285 family lipoprotein [Acinetobacter sp. KS-LM10]|uniref:CC0125/CC1285 family lipoprotein n=1 Tax=Acinetobacter sp. KS-LM10 TaxID=3120518 RepID=UPI0030D54931
MKISLISLTILAVLAVSGCASIPSKPRTFDQLGNFSSIPLNTQTYRISFQGSSNMSFGTAEEITLLKAAQTSVLNGFQFFKVMDDPSNRTQQPPRQAVVYPSPTYYGYGYGYRRHPAFYDPFYDMPYVVTVDPVQVSYTIQCFKDKKSAPNDAFDARLILQSLGQKYGVSSTGAVLPVQTETSTDKQ